MSALPQMLTSELGLRYVRRNSSGSFAILTAIRRASSLLNNFAADRRPGSLS